MTEDSHCQECVTPPYSLIGKPKASSVIAQILALANRPEVISFAGGLPSPEGFPVKAIQEAADRTLENEALTALQYSGAAGMASLRNAIASYETQAGVPTSADEVIIVSGSQQGLDLIARTFVDLGSKILVERPTYLGALFAFNLCQPKYVDLQHDDKGLDPTKIGEEARGARFAYVMPTFQNPTGLTIDEERRQQLADKAREYDFWIVEDNPYGELYYGDKPPCSLRAFAPERTLRLGTMSKILAPGLRLGYICGPKHVLQALIQVKTNMDLHTSTYAQLLTARVMNAGLLETHLPNVRKLYREKAQVMLDSLELHMPKHPQVSWTKPSGGMFIWLNLPKGLNSADLLRRVLDSDVPVGFVPGEAFYSQDAEVDHCRLSFVTVPSQKIRAGVESLAKALTSLIEERGL